MLDPSSTKVLSSQQRTMIFLKRGVYVLQGSRCCSDHLYLGHLTAESFNQIIVSQPDSLDIDSEGLQEFISDVRSILLERKSMDFNDPSCLNDEAYRILFGLRKGI